MVGPGTPDTDRNSVPSGPLGKMLYAGYRKVRNEDVQNRPVHTFFANGGPPDKRDNSDIILLIATTIPAIGVARRGISVLLTSTFSPNVLKSKSWDSP